VRFVTTAGSRLREQLVTTGGQTARAACCGSTAEISPNRSRSRDIPTVVLDESIGYEFLALSKLGFSSRPNLEKWNYKIFSPIYDRASLPPEQFAVSRLSQIDCDLDCVIRAEIVAVVSMLFHEPMPNPSLNLTDKVEAALFSQLSEIADRVCDRMLVIRAEPWLKYR
jgi:hypothetical protein